ncbi:MAG TPA: hypothetical protein VGW40_15185 [Allosphingosinicella sp.]|nr:hypothetical protein [Allosphingosinicella sp.]
MARNSSDPKTAVSSALLRMEAEAKAAGFTLTRAMIAEGAGVAASAVSSWFQAKQLPRQKQLDTLATALSLGDDGRAAGYREQLYKAAGIKLPPLEPLERAQRGETISIGIVRYDDDAVDRFFEAVICAFGAFCGFRTDPKPINFAELTTALASGEVDLAAGLWETPGRLRDLRFIGTPVEMGMNLLTFEKAERGIPVKSGRFDVEAIEPIMNDGQAVYGFAQHVLGIPKHRIALQPYGPDSFGRELLQRCKEWASGERKHIPVVVSDELMLLKVHNWLVSEMLADEPDSLRQLGLPHLIAGESAPRWERAGSLIAIHPRYNLALAVKRVMNDTWHPYLEDAWRIFVRGNREFLADQYRELCERLSRILSETEEVLEKASTVVNGAQINRIDAWRRVVRAWLFDAGLRDYHEEQSWRRIWDRIKSVPDFPDELREKKGPKNHE